MPSGSARRIYLKNIAEIRPLPGFLVKIERKINTTDAILARNGLIERSLELGVEYDENYRQMPLSKKLEYLKICIDVFETLMDEYGFGWNGLKG